MNVIKDLKSSDIFEKKEKDIFAIRRNYVIVLWFMIRIIDLMSIKKLFFAAKIVSAS